MMILPVTALKSYDFLIRHAALKTKVILYEKEMEACRQHTLEREYTLREFQRLGKSMEESLDRIETFVSENRLEEAVSISGDFFLRQEEALMDWSAVEI